MWRAEETYRESKQVEAEDKDSIGRVLLSAGTALLMAACLKRAVVLFLVEQWRIWVFLVLNLIVVAIFFTSSPSSYNGNQSQSQSQSQEPSAKTKQKEIKKRECKEGEKVEFKRPQMDKEEEIKEEEEEEEEEVGLSKEELNERVEAFIVMFKKQLISDARKGGKRRTPFSYNTR